MRSKARRTQPSHSSLQLFVDHFLRGASRAMKPDLTTSTCGYFPVVARVSVERDANLVAESEIGGLTRGRFVGSNAEGGSLLAGITVDCTGTVRVVGHPGTEPIRGFQRVAQTVFSFWSLPPIWPPTLLLMMDSIPLLSSFLNSSGDFLRGGEYPSSSNPRSRRKSPCKLYLAELGGGAVSKRSPSAHTRIWKPSY